jgi:hypothetical protein
MRLMLGFAVLNLSSHYVQACLKRPVTQATRTLLGSFSKMIKVPFQQTTRFTTSKDPKKSKKIDNPDLQEQAETFQAALADSCINVAPNLHPRSRCLETCGCQASSMLQKNPALLDAKVNGMSPVLLSIVLQRPWLLHGLLKQRAKTEAKPDLVLALLAYLKAQDAIDIKNAQQIAIMLCAHRLEQGKELLAAKLFVHPKDSFKEAQDTIEKIDEIYDEAVRYNKMRKS